MYYLSCMDANETIESLGAQPMLNLLKKIGGWNISTSAGKSFNVSAWNLQSIIITLQNRYNMGGLFSWAVGEDDRNSSRHVIQVSMLTVIFCRSFKAISNLKFPSISYNYGGKKFKLKRSDNNYYLAEILKEFLS